MRSSRSRSCPWLPHWQTADLRRVALRPIPKQRRGAGVSRLALTLRSSRLSPDESRHDSNGGWNNEVRRVCHRNQGLQRLDLRERSGRNMDSGAVPVEVQVPEPHYPEQEARSGGQGLLDFLPPEAVKSIVVFSGDAEFKTETPQGVIEIGQLTEYPRQQTEVVMSPNRLQFCVGRLETTRLAVSRATDVEHIQSLARRHGNGAA